MFTVASDTTNEAKANQCLGYPPISHFTNNLNLARNLRPAVDFDIAVRLNPTDADVSLLQG
jgi:hypothetical protein